MAAHTPSTDATTRFFGQRDMTPPTRNPPSTTSIAATTTYRAPFVDGTPVTRGSGSEAARSARASALN